MTPRDRLFSAARDPVWAAALAVLTALAISFVVVLASGKNAALGLAYLFEGAFGGPGPLGETAVKSGVLILTGLSVAVAFTVGLFNIGVEGGQLTVIAGMFLAVGWLRDREWYHRRVVVPICHEEIVQWGDTSTNYQLLPGDRIYVPTLPLCQRLFGRGKRVCAPCGGCPWLSPALAPSSAG